MHRLHAESGTPVEVGLWECDLGGWPVVARSDTEIAHIISGRATVSDEDGTPHEVGPGDILVLPRGWTGRWLITERLRKLYVLA